MKKTNKMAANPKLYYVFRSSYRFKKVAARWTSLKNVAFRGKIFFSGAILKFLETHFTLFFDCVVGTNQNNFMAIRGW
jgi:hypothetical protein